MQITRKNSIVLLFSILLLILNWLCSNRSSLCSAATALVGSKTYRYLYS